MPRERTDTSRTELPLGRARELLEAKRARLVDRLGQDWRQVYDVADRPPLDEGERSSHEQLASVAHGRSSVELQQLREIDEALVRIESGDYGVCEDCDEPIDPARLEAIPETRLCIACAEQAASERRAHRAAGEGPVSQPRGARSTPQRELAARALDAATQNDAPEPEEDEPAEEAAVFPEPDPSERPER
jgi:DnaK suppressor protein